MYSSDTVRPTTTSWQSGVYNGTAGLSGNLCWRTGYWAPSMAIVECDPGSRSRSPHRALLRRCPLPPPPPAARTRRPRLAVQKITLASKALFDFDKAVLKPEGKAAIDSEIISQAEGRAEARAGAGHGSHRPIGTQAYNQKLSERRADAVRDYLVSQGRAEGQDRDAGHGQDAADSGRGLQPEEPEGTDRVLRT